MTPAAPLVGILTDSSVVRSRGPASVVGVDLDASTHRFLTDHLVDSRPLLSTVMGIEAVACAISLTRPDATIGAFIDVKVGPPYLLPPSGRGAVEVVIQGEPASASELRCEVWSRPADGPAVLHYSALASLCRPAPAPAIVRPVEDGPSTGADEIYQLYFHGESFRVLESARLGSSGMTGVLAAGLPSIIEPARRSITAPLLIELCLQTAGLWELAMLDSMRIPAGIDRIVRLTDLDADAAATLTAVVTPRPDEDAGYVFDAVVLDDLGQPHLTVEGYRSTEFAHPHDRAAARRIRASFDRA